MSLIETSKAKRQEQELAKKYLGAVLRSCGSTEHFDVFANPRHLGIVHSRANPPCDSDTHQLYDRFCGIDAVGLMRSKHSEILAVTQQGLKPTPMLDITHFNVSLLWHALAQEMSLSGKDAVISDVDPLVWAATPELIRRHYRKFNYQLQVHIMDYMSTYLETQQRIGASQTDPKLFTVSHRDIPHIPVQLSGETCDLMLVLVSLNPVNLNQLMPAETERLKLRLNNVDASTPPKHFF